MHPATLHEKKTLATNVQFEVLIQRLKFGGLVLYGR
jgi:hypothetical protein